MAVSGSTNFSQNVSSLIRDSLILLGVATPSSTIGSSTDEVCRRALNRMVKAWNLQGAHLWAQREGALVLEEGVAKYTFADSSLSGASVGLVNDDVLVQSTISADEASGQTVLSITDTTDMAATNKVIIEQDDGTRHETTIVSVDSATQITITAALTDEASTDNFVYAYPVAATQANQFYPRQIFNVRLKDSAGYERELFNLSRSDYYMISNKTTAGTPSQYYIDDQLTNKTISFYPVPDSIRNSVRFTYAKSLDDLDALTDDVEFSSEWYDAIIYNLAVNIAPMFGKDDRVVRLIMPLARQFLIEARFLDDEKVNVQIQPNSEDYD